MINNSHSTIERFVSRFQSKGFWEISYILLLPILVVFLYRFTPFNNEDGYLDPWIYFAYTHNFMDLIGRYGLPYYSVRHGLIIPLLALTKVFGPINGYLAFIYLMYLLAGVPLYLLFRKNYSKHAAIMAYTILVSSIWFARTVLWTHPDASAVPYLIAAYAILLLEPKRKRIANLAIGALIGLAVNSNAFALAIGGLMGCAYLLYHKRALRERLIQDLPWLVAGFLAVFVVGMAFYYRCCDQINYFQSTLGMMLWSVKGSGQVYQQQLSELLNSKYLYLPLFLLCAVGIIYRNANTEDRRLLSAFMAYLGTVIVFCIWYQYTTKTAILEYFYYFSFFIAPSIFCMAAIPALLSKNGNSGDRTLYLATTTFLLIPWIIVDVVQLNLEYLSVYWMWAGFAIALFALWLSNNYKKITPFAIIIFVLAIQMPLLATNDYVRMYGAGDEFGLTRYRLGLKFIETMPRLKEDDKFPIFFWYSNADKLANSLQSTYLWGFSKIFDSDKETKGLPYIKGFLAEWLGKHDKYHLVLFDRDPRNINLGLDELRKNGFVFGIQKSTEICEQSLCYSIVILIIDKTLPKS